MAMQSSPEEPQRLATVVQAVKNWVERCGAVWVEAQVIELRRTSGAVQFLTLRDLTAEVSASVTASSRVLDMAGPITQGMTVAALLKPTVWAKSGRLSFDCAEIRVAGEGRLLAMLEQRKRMLQAEGLFDPASKKQLPFLPRAIGLVTGQNTAAERDVVTNICNRWPAAHIETRHALVQGPSSAGEVMRALAELDQIPEVEVIIIARGGGSLEDLLPFSDEGLVRAVAAARTPIVSAIGHEPDNPIIDLAADVRASTPTDAAKRVVPDAREQAQLINQGRSRIRQAIVAKVRDEQRALDLIRSRPVLQNPAASFDSHVERLTMLRDRLSRAITTQLDQQSTAVAHDLTRVRAMSPKATLERGYAILADGAGQSVTSIFDLDMDDDVMAYLADGTVTMSVRGITDPEGTSVVDDEFTDPDFTDLPGQEL